MTPNPLPEPILADVSGFFDALGDVSRLKILRALLDAGEPLCQGRVAEATGLSQANTSKHLASLVRVGLVHREPMGNLVFFKPLLPLSKTLCELVTHHVSARVRSSFQSLV